MRLTYIFHSGFAIETDRCILIFDYWMDPEGIVPQLLKTEKPVYVFSSHFHEDHFNRGNLFVAANEVRHHLYPLERYPETSPGTERRSRCLAC